MQNNNEDVKQNQKLDKTKSPSNIDLVSSLSLNVLSKRDKTAIDNDTTKKDDVKPKTEKQKSKIPQPINQRNTKAKKKNMGKEVKATKIIANASSDNQLKAELSSTYNNRILYKKKHVKLDQRVFNVIVKHTLSLDLPIYRIIELILIDYCLGNYPSSTKDMNELLKQYSEKE